jgi:hypothetical protein
MAMPRLAARLSVRYLEPTDLVQAKAAVFVTMGASHAPRIEKALRATLQ